MAEEVYVGEYNRCPVQIKKVRDKWGVYDLKEIECTNVTYLDPLRPSELKCKFKWGEKPKESYDYKPFEDDDVSKDPGVMYEHARTWCPHKVRWTIPTYTSAKKAKGFIKV